MVTDPERIETSEQLSQMLGELFRDGGWSINRLAAASGLSTATVQAIVNGTTTIPRTSTLKAFVTACGQEFGPWVAARGRAVRVAGTRARVVNVPRVESTFVGRIQELDRLTRALSEPSRASRPGGMLHVIHGLGGVGKSTLAAYWARTQLGKDHEVAWWITADTQAGLQAGLADLAVALEPTSAGQPLEVLTELAINWLTSHPRWLLMLDNVTSPADVTPLLNRGLPGKVVVTSRLSEGWHRLGATVLHLDVLSEQEAVQLLTDITAADTADREMSGATELVRILGCLPLAIDQAAGFLHQTRMSPDAYIELLRENPAVMYDRAAHGSDAERTIARIWRITLDTLADTPLAGQLLRILAWWAPQAVPRSLLVPIASPTDLNTALGSLAAYNMITLDASTITVHRLVQAVARTPDIHDPHRQSVDISIAHDEATDLLGQGSPDTVNDPTHWPTWRLLLPHFEALAPQTFESAGYGGDAEAAPVVVLSWRSLHSVGTLTNRAAHFLLSQGAIQRAIAHFESSLELVTQLCGDHAPDTLAARSSLAEAYRRAGDLVRALRLFRATLVDMERELGENHPDTLNTSNNLASAYLAAGNTKRAISLHERTLARRMQVLSSDHPDILVSRNNLAHAYLAVRDMNRAISLFEAVLTASEQTLGSDHPDTLNSRNNLASAYTAVGNAKQAIQLYERTLADCERVLGDDHPLTTAVRSHLSKARRPPGAPPAPPTR